MIIVTTGTPGSGKTLYTIDYVKKWAEREGGRPVFYSGIPDLKLPWTEIEPEKWMDCPPNSIVVIDECQRVFRPRANGSQVPPYIAQLETHRHKGLDIVLITQHPMLIDQNIRRLAGKHFHLQRIYGFHKATLMEFQSVRENCDKNNKDALKTTWNYPKNVFDYYKSAEVHTHKGKLPKHFYYLIALVFLFLAGVAYIYNKRTSPVEPSTDQAQTTPEQSIQQTPTRPGEQLTVFDYLNQHQPRVAGLPHTAPIYDGVTKPVRAPYPAACVQSATRCRCYTQQGTRMDTPETLCKDIAAGGFFMAWDNGEGAQVVKASDTPTLGGGNIEAMQSHTPTRPPPPDTAQQVADGAALRFAREN